MSRFTLRLPEGLDRWLLAALMLCVVFLRWQALPEYPFHEDETGSIHVMQSIVRTGMPLTESGHIYWRSLLGHYLMAIPLFFAELSPRSARLVPVLFSALCLPLVFSYARRFGGRSAAWGSVLFLSFSAYQNLFASMARFYLPFQFFFLAAFILSEDFFIHRKKGSGPWLLAATLGCLGTHIFALQLLPVFGMGLLVGKRRDLLHSLRFWGCGLFLVAAGYLFLVFQPPGGYVNYAALPIRMGGYPDKLAFLKWFRETIPFGLSLLLLCLGPLLLSRSRSWIFSVLGFALSLLGLSLFAPGGNPRYLSHLFPLGVLLGSVSLMWWMRYPAALQRDLALRRPAALTTAGLVLFAALACGVLYPSPEVGKAFGNRLNFVDQKPAHDFIAARLAPGDVLVSMEPAFAPLYLGRKADYYLREKIDEGKQGYRSFTVREKEIFTIPVIDSPEALRQLLANTRGSIWIYANWKLAWAVSPQIKELLRTSFTQAYSDGRTFVLHKP